MGLSAAGAHAALKKLESNGIVKAEKLGTGLFYEVNLNERKAFHLGAIALLEKAEAAEIPFLSIAHESKAAIFDGKQLLVVTSQAEKVKSAIYREMKEVNVICKTEEQFSAALIQKEADVAGILAKGKALFGEEMILEAIRKARR